MSSRTHRDQGAHAAPSPSIPAEFPPDPAPGSSTRGTDHRRGHRWAVLVLAVALVAALAAGGYLLSLARAWEDRAEALEGSAHELGSDLGQVRAELEESRSALALVESQLDGAQDQIRELADTVAQTGDDREVQRQVAEYQRQLSGAAAAVAEAMDECIASQEELVEHLEAAARPEPTDTPSPDPSPSPSGPAPSAEPTAPETDVAALQQEVDALCQLAEDAHAGLQERLEGT